MPQLGCLVLAQFACIQTGRYSCIVVGRDAYVFNDMGIGAPSRTVWQAFLSSHGAICLYADGAALLYSGGEAYNFQRYGHWCAFLHRVARYAVLCVGAEILSNIGAALNLDQWRAFLHRVVRYVGMCVGAPVLPRFILGECLS